MYNTSASPRLHSRAHSRRRIVYASVVLSFVFVLVLTLSSGSRLALLSEDDATYPTRPKGNVVGIAQPHGDHVIDGDIDEHAAKLVIVGDDEEEAEAEAEAAEEEANNKINNNNAETYDPSRYDKTDPLAYRKHLDEFHAPHPFTKHSPKLTFSNIYVLSLPNRTDRRERMTKLLSALGLQFQFVDATSSEDPVIKWIGEHVVQVRNEKRKIISDTLKVDPQFVGGMGPHSVWFDPSVRPSKIKLTTLEAVYNRPQSKVTTKMPYPSLARSEYGGMDWVEYLNSLPENSPLLHPSNPDFNVTAEAWDDLEKNSNRQVRNAVIATWYSQVKVLKMMRDNGDESALVLEDDVDIEWDISRIWPNVWRRLPKENNGVTQEWEMVFLGNCWGKELQKPIYLHPYLHRSSEPRCLHGYAMSQPGYNKLLQLLNDPWLAYQGAIDTAVPTLIGKQYIASFSVEPSIIIQPKDTPSDILSGSGSPWKGILADSTMNRILRDEGNIIPDNRVPGPRDFRNPALTAGYRLSSESALADRRAKKLEASLTGLDGVETRAKLAKEEEEARRNNENL